MGANYSWFLPDRIIFVECYDNIVAKDLVDGNDIVLHMIEESPEAVMYVLFDLTKLKGIKIGPQDAGNVLQYLRHPKLNHIILWGLSGPVRMLVDFMAMVLRGSIGAKIHVSESQNEGLAYLNKLDSTLPNLLEMGS